MTQWNITPDQIEHLTAPRFTARWHTGETVGGEHRIMVTVTEWRDGLPPNTEALRLVDEATKAIDQWIMERV